MNTQEDFINKVHKRLEVFIVQAKYYGAFADIPEDKLPQAISGMIDVAKERAIKSLNW